MSECRRPVKADYVLSEAHERGMSERAVEEICGGAACSCFEATR